jgi:hypothetical protein
MKWASLSVEIFNRFVWDGKQASICRAVCKDWRRQIDKIPRFVDAIQRHHIDVRDMKEFRAEMCGKSRKLQYITEHTAHVRLNHILWHQHNFNMYMIHHNVLPDIIRLFGWDGEDEKYYVDVITGDLVINNNCYFLRKDHEMHLLEDIFKGTMTWKVIHFPVQEQRINILGGDYHRGTSFQVRFKKHDEPCYLKRGLTPILQNEGKGKRNRRDLTTTEARYDKESGLEYKRLRRTLWKGLK